MVHVEHSAEIHAAFAEAIKHDCFRWDTNYGAGIDGTSVRRSPAFAKPYDARITGYMPEHGQPNF